MKTWFVVVLVIASLSFGMATGFTIGVLKGRMEVVLSDLDRILYGLNHTNKTYRALRKHLGQGGN